MRPALVYYGLLASLVALVAVAFDSLYGDSHAATGLRLALGTVLVAEGVLLAAQRSRLGRRKFLEYMLGRIGRGRGWRFVLGPMLLATGVIFAAVGGLELARGLRGLF